MQENSIEPFGDEISNKIMVYDYGNGLPVM